jgi:hypothetical protein
MEVTLFPPEQGLFKPNAVYNPLMGNGKFSTLNNWRINSGALAALAGYIDLPGGLFVQTLDNATTNVCLFSYQNGTTGATELFYVNGKSLRKITSAGETELDAAITAAADGVRMPYAEFRNRFLIGTKTNGLHWLNPATGATRKCGVTPPGAAPTLAAGAAGILSGVYKGAYTYVNDQGNESNPCPLTATFTAASQQIAWSGITAGPTGTVSRRLYRTTANGALYLYLTVISDNVTTTYTDNNADTSLGSVMDEDNDVPPTNILQIINTSKRVYLVDGSDGITLWACKFDDETGEPNFEAYPPALSIEIPFLGGEDHFHAAIDFNNVLYAAGKWSIHAIHGDPATGIQRYQALDEGLASPYAWCLTPDGILYVSNGKKLKLWAGEGAPVDLGVDIQGLLDNMYVGTYYPTLSAVELIYDDSRNQVLIQYPYSSGGGPPSTNLRGFVLDWDTKKFSATTYPFDMMHYSKADGNIYATLFQDSTIVYMSGYLAKTIQFTDQRAEFIQFSPYPGKQAFFSRFGIVAKALPIVSFVPPTLKVEIAVNGSADYVTTYVDLTKDFLNKTDGETPITRTGYAPIYQRAESITVRLSTVNNAASLAGVEIYKIFFNVEEEDYTDSKNRDWKRR